MWLAVVVSITLVPLLLYLLGRTDEARVRQDWERLLSARDDELCEQIAARWKDEMVQADRSCAEALAAHGTGALAEAMHLLDVAYRILEKSAPDLSLLSREVLEAFAHLVRARERIESADLLWQLAERREQWRETPPTSTLVLWTALTCALLVVLAL